MTIHFSFTPCKDKVTCPRVGDVTTLYNITTLTVLLKSEPRLTTCCQTNFRDHFTNTKTFNIVLTVPYQRGIEAPIF